MQSAIVNLVFVFVLAPSQKRYGICYSPHGGSACRDVCCDVCGSASGPEPQSRNNDDKSDKVHE